MQTSEIKEFNGFTAAVYYKYFAQDINPYIERRQPIEKIAARGFYQKNKKAFDKFVKIYQKYSIDILKYFKFLIYECRKTEKDAAEVLLSQVYLSKFIDYLKVNNQYYRIYKYFLKSAENIANDCVKLGFMSTKEYIRHLIATRMLATKYVAGEISIYYLSAIQNFKKIILKLDPISQAEFSKILNRYDKYNSDVQDAFKIYKSCRINPIKFTDELIWKKLEQKQNNNNSK